ncbi:uncharacterized protein LOC119291229 [Triticum dicoccoides]|uniref:uncharacterized protein LOC119291229 n=1 Tax=Triticum dicoccoides TaxID=85692 RepID=UPI0018900635|nr:uncharacterized protein LOC119291229 [Triticum dicoccoides]
MRASTPQLSACCSSGRPPPSWSPGADADAAAGGGGADSSWACRVGEVSGLCHSSTNRIKIVSYMGHLVELFPEGARMPLLPLLILPSTPSLWNTSTPSLEPPMPSYSGSGR